MSKRKLYKGNNGGWGGLKQGITSRYINVCFGKEVIGVNVD